MPPQDAPRGAEYSDETDEEDRPLAQYKNSQPVGTTQRSEFILFSSILHQLLR